MDEEELQMKYFVMKLKNKFNVLALMLEINKHGTITGEQLAKAIIKAQVD